MRAKRKVLIWLACVVTSTVLAGFSFAEMMPVYQKTRLVGDWFQIARSPSLFEHNCHAVKVKISTREDSRMTIKMICHKGSVSGPVLAIDGILVQHEPSVFGMRFVRHRQFGDVTLIVLWQAEDDSLAVLGSPIGQVGWVLSKSAKTDPETLALGIKKLVDAGYSESVIRIVKQAP